MKKSGWMTGMFLVGLVAAGCTPSIVDDVRQHRASQIEVAIANGQSPNQRDVLGRPAIWLAAWYDENQAVDALLRAGADPNVLDLSKHYTPLILAVQHNDLEMVNSLLAANANPNIQNDTGYTPLHYALLQKNYDIAEALVNHGASTTIKNKSGITSADLARISGTNLSPAK